MQLRLKTFIILCAVLIRFIFRGKANKELKEVKTVVLFFGGKFGDTICATPVFCAIKKSYPQCRLIMMGNAINKAVLEYNPDVDVVYVYEEESIMNTILTIRREKPDFGCIVSPGALGLAILYLSGVKHIAAPRVQNGWSPFETKSYKVIQKLVTVKDFYMGEYMPREYLKLLEPIGIHTTDTKKYVFWSNKAEEAMKQFVDRAAGQAALRIGIMPGAGNKIKQWPAERFGVVADYLIRTYKAHVFIIGNASNRTEIDLMRKSMQYKEHTHDCSFTTVDEIKALVSKMDMTISVDTGPIFIAEARGVPTIDIGGVIHPNDMAPNDGDLHVLITYGGEPLLWSMNSRVYDHEAAQKGVESITVERVVAEADKLIKKITKGKRYAKKG